MSRFKDKNAMPRFLGDFVRLVSALSLVAILAPNSVSKLGGRFGICACPGQCKVGPILCVNYIGH